jgi:hypothetical protein
MRYIFILLYFLPIAAAAQFSISFGTGRGSFSMTDLRNQQLSVRNAMPVKAKVISSFPDYWFYNGGMKWAFENGIMFGADGSYTSSGGRLYYSDYSGKIIYDQTVKSFSVSTLIGKIFKLNGESVTLQCYLMVGTTFSKYDDHYSEQSDFSRDNKFELSGKSRFMQPVINLSKRFGFVAANVSLGYYQTVIPGNLSMTSSGSQPSNGYSFTADWSGLRVGCGLSFYFRKQ